jgi:photosystem II stability/assembly factor-like uncharacterized protein
MKKILFYTLITFSICISGNCSWIPIYVNGGSNIKYIQFLNNNTGWALSNSHLIKTINGGLIWSTIYNSSIYQSGFAFINENIGWRADFTVYPSPFGGIYKTTNGGINWAVQYNGPDIYTDLYFYDENFGYASSYYRTTNGGVNWNAFAYNGDYGVFQKIFVSNWCGYSVNSKIFRTINTGTNWTILYDNNSVLYQFYSVSFLDSLNGFVSGKLNSNNSGVVFKTISGGANWNIINTNTESLKRISFINVNIGYAISDNKVYRTSNSGLNWNRQLCDTSNYFNRIVFNDTLHGWIACNNNIIMITTNGGSTFVNQIANEEPVKFSLFQNYPNPFNPNTNIKYQIKNIKFVTLKIFDILGKEITTLVNEKQSPGTYEVTFDGSKLSSGIYFYRIETDGFTDTKRMILLK